MRVPRARRCAHTHNARRRRVRELRRLCGSAVTTASIGPVAPSHGTGGLRLPRLVHLPIGSPIRQNMASVWMLWKEETPQERGFSRAGDGARTHDPQLGKLMLYQLSYARVGGQL